jgi:glycosidase
MSERLYKEVVIDCIDVESFQDSDGDGYGDLHGLISYLSPLGVTCLWLNPIHSTPRPIATMATTWPTTHNLADKAGHGRRRQARRDDGSPVRDHG